MSRRDIRSVCGSNSRHWFAGSRVCQRCGALNPQMANVAAPRQVEFSNTRAAKLLREHAQLLAFVKLLASYDCAGPPACEPLTEDVATGKREGGICSVCEAREWLAERGYLR